MKVCLSGLYTKWKYEKQGQITRKQESMGGNAVNQGSGVKDREFSGLIGWGKKLLQNLKIVIFCT